MDACATASAQHSDNLIGDLGGEAGTGRGRRQYGRIVLAHHIGYYVLSYWLVGTCLMMKAGGSQLSIMCMFCAL